MADKHKQIEDAIIQDWTISGRGRLFKNPTGSAWLGKVCNTNRPGTVLLEFARKIPYGLDIGSSDLIGFEYRETIGGTGIRDDVPTFCSIEVKTMAKSTLTAKQKEWLNFIVNSGGRGYVAMETDDGYDLREWEVSV